MGPIDYSSTFPQIDLGQKFLSGLQAGASLGELQQQQAAKQAAQQQAAQYQADIAAFNQAPSAQAAMALQTKYPQYAKPISDAFGTYSADQQKVELRDAATLTNLLHANRTDLATQEIDKRIEAAKNTGLPTNQLEALKSVIENDPKAALAHSLTIMAALPGGKDVLANLQGINKDARDQTESETKVAGEQADNVLKNLGIVGQKAGALAKPGVKPAQAEAMFRTLAAQGVIPKADLQGYIDGIPADLTALPDYLKQVQASGMTAKEQMGFTTPDANTVANNDRIAKEGAANRANQVKVTEMVSAREGSKGGDVDEKQVENVAQLIADGRMAPLGAMAMRTSYGQAVMSRVAEINPAYRAQDFGTTSKAEKEFATGKLGNSVRSFNVGLSHLDTLGQLADALGNKDTPAINRLGNYFASQTGKPAPTNFQGAKKIVGDEIVKAIVGAGGGVADREEAQKIFDAANSPAQLKGAVKTVQELMVGQLGGLEQQYRTATKRDDFNRFLSPQAAALYGKHGGAGATHAGPAVGTVEAGKDGQRYRFKGGDAGQASSWEKL